MGLPAEAGVCQAHTLPIVKECARCGDFGCGKCFEGGRSLCERCAPPGADRQLDLGASLKWPFGDPMFATSLLIGGACVLFSFLLVPMFLLLGYRLRVARAVRADESATLPTWDDPGALLWDGFKVWLASFLPALAFEAIIGGIIGVIVLVVALAAGPSAGGPGGPPPGLVIAGVVGYIVLIVLLLVFSLLFAYIHPAIELRYLRTGSVLVGFELRELWKIVSTRPGRYAELFLFTLVVGLLGNVAGQLLLCIGLLATIPWSFMVEAHLLGNHWARDDAEEDVA